MPRGRGVHTTSHANHGGNVHNFLTQQKSHTKTHHECERNVRNLFGILQWFRIQQFVAVSDLLGEFLDGSVDVCFVRFVLQHKQEGRTSPTPDSVSNRSPASTKHLSPCRYADKGDVFAQGNLPAQKCRDFPTSASWCDPAPLSRWLIDGCVFSGNAVSSAWPSATLDGKPMRTSCGIACQDSRRGRGAVRNPCKRIAHEPATRHRQKKRNEKQPPVLSFGPLDNLVRVSAERRPMPSQRLRNLTSKADSLPLINDELVCRIHRTFERTNIKTSKERTSKERTTNNEQRTTNNEQRTTNNEQRTTNNEQPTTNNEQPTTNNEQRTTNNQQPTTNCGGAPAALLPFARSLAHSQPLTFSRTTTNF